MKREPSQGEKPFVFLNKLDKSFSLIDLKKSCPSSNYRGNIPPSCHVLTGEIPPNFAKYRSNQASRPMRMALP